MKQLVRVWFYLPHGSGSLLFSIHMIDDRKTWRVWATLFSRHQGMPSTQGTALRILALQPRDITEHGTALLPGRFFLQLPGTRILKLDYH